MNNGPFEKAILRLLAVSVTVPNFTVYWVITIVFILKTWELKHKIVLISWAVAKLNLSMEFGSSGVPTSHTNVSPALVLSPRTSPLF